MTQAHLIEHIACLAELRGKEWDIEGVRLAAGQGNPFPKFAKEIRAMAVSDADGGADYEAKASELVTELCCARPFLGIRLVTAALAQSAADERKRCEAIAREFAPYGTGVAIADAIAALAETKGEGRCP